MQLVFRPLAPTAAPEPYPAGELHVRPAAPHPEHTRTGLALTALREGPAGFLRGPGPVERIVVQADPTLDDLLAAVVLEGQLAGQSFPPDAPVAHYAAALAAGLHPAEGVPPEELVEGVFAHYRHAAGDPLTDPGRAAKFLAAWAKLAAVLREALLDPARDPFRQSLLAGRPDFHAERLYLRKDRAVYERDVRNGQRLLVRLPGERGELPALRLVEPRSVLFKYWARTDPAAGGGGKTGYHFLAVRWPNNDWFFSTDPLDRHDIGSLARDLQAAEVRKNPHRASPDDPDPWYDGRRHSHSIVRPPRGGTALTEQEVWAAVVKWGDVRPAPTAPRPVRRGLAAAGVVAAVGALVAVITLVDWKRPASVAGTDPPQRLVDPSPNPPGISPHDPTEEFAQSGVADLPPPFHLPEMTFARGEKPKQFTDLALSHTRPGEPILVWLEAASVAKPPAGVKLRLPDGRTEEVAAWEGKERAWRSPAFRTPVPADPRVSLTVPNPKPDAEGASLDLTLRWRPNPHELHLHVLTIGVSNYAAPGGPRPLKYCTDDAKALRDAFAALKGPLFTEVYAETLTDPTSDRVIDELHAFKKRVRADRPALKLAVVTFAGHGTVFDRERFVFLPADYNGQRSTAVSWGQLKESLGELGCTTLVILDCCHSGQAALEQATDGARSHGDNKGLGDAITAFADQRPGLFLLAAADRAGLAFEDPDLKHGVMSWAVLEVLAGRTGPGRGGLVTLKDLYDHVSLAVPQRVRAGDAGREQVIVPSFPGGRVPEKIPIAYFPRR